MGATAERLLLGGVCVMTFVLYLMTTILPLAAFFLYIKNAELKEEIKKLEDQKWALVDENRKLKNRINRINKIKQGRVS